MRFIFTRGALKRLACLGVLFILGAFERTARVTEGLVAVVQELAQP